jgi:hypothetical protein
MTTRLLLSVFQFPSLLAGLASGTQETNAKAQR